MSTNMKVVRGPWSVVRRPRSVGGVPHRAPAFGVRQLVGAFAPGKDAAGVGARAFVGDSVDKSTHSKRWRDMLRPRSGATRSVGSAPAKRSGDGALDILPTAVETPTSRVPSGQNPKRRGASLPAAVQNAGAVAGRNQSPDFPRAAGLLQSSKSGSRREAPLGDAIFRGQRSKRRAGVSPALQTRERERPSKFTVGFADGGRRDARPTLRSIATPYVPAHAAGFTIIETIAVMAVIAILAAVLVPSAIKRIDRAAWTQETVNLSTIADALTQSIIRSKTVPDSTNWASAVATQANLPVSAVSTNARRYARAFLVDPALSINGAGLPYTQSANGTTKPNSARVMILSSLARALPITNGVPPATDFNNIWNAAENTVPPGTPFTGWAGTGEDLRIKKINLEPLFYQLILFNHDPTNAPPGPFSIDRGTTNTVTSGPPGWNSYYLASSDVWLLDSNRNLRTRYLLNRSISFVFESGSWRGQIQGGETFSETSGETASTFLRLANAFYTAPTNPSAGQGASPSAVLVTLYTFMFDYVFWATECPNFDWHGDPSGNLSNLPEYNMLNDIGQSSATGSIDKYAGNGGLLK